VIAELRRALPACTYGVRPPLPLSEEALDLIGSTGATVVATVLGSTVRVLRPVRGRWRVIGTRLARATILAVTAGSLAFSGCSSSSSPPHWAQLRSVSVTVAQPGVPPPAGLPRTTVFATSSEVARVTAALNRHHISRGGSPDATEECAGGTVVTIRIVSAKAGTAPVPLHAYLCGGHQSGDAAGDVRGFLAELRL
jgi:hypothetical protein